MTNENLTIPIHSERRDQPVPSKVCGYFFIVSILFTSLSCSFHIHIGAEVLIADHLDLLYGKRRVGIICNQTSVFPDGTHLVDSLLGLGVNVTTLFGPEHGIRGVAGAGEAVENGRDTKTKLPVYSLYGKINRPTDQMLKSIDLLIFDIQDVGSRFYTYASTMAYCIEAAGRNGTQIVILDRPNPINGADIEGPLLDTTYHSFVGLFPIPIRHGLTLGELASMIVGERWFGGKFRVNLTVIPLEGWNRTMWYDQTGLEWIPPSPNMKTESTAVVYPGTCLFEATNVSEGRGTEKPFESIGAPWIDGAVLSERMNALHLDSVNFTPIHFTPIADPIASPDPKYKNRDCGGVYIQVKDRNYFRPVETGLLMLEMINILYPDSLRIRSEMMDRLAGTSDVRTSILNHTSMRKVLEASTQELKDFLPIRHRYLLYE